MKVPVDDSLCARTVVLCGPDPRARRVAYGGGKGGYVRNVDLLLQHFSGGDICMVLSPYSARSYSRWWLVALPIRLLRDLGGFSCKVRRGRAVHLMMTYGLAIYREFGISVIAKLFRRPVILDIRGGSFVPWFQSTGRLQRALAHKVLTNARLILGQGAAVVAYLRPGYGEKVHHFPNFVQCGQLRGSSADRFSGAEMRVGFVGFCYRSKGVFELVQGCSRAAQDGVPIHLTLIGAESAEFAAYLDTFTPPPGLRITRTGACEFETVQQLLQLQDIFCFPSRHPGEGHPNAITEAMANSLVIVATRHGFIPEVLDESAAYLMDTGTTEEVAALLRYIDANRDEARAKAARARAIVESRFTEERVLGDLRLLYLQALAVTTP